MRILRKRRIIATGSSSTCPEMPPVRPKGKLRRPTCQLLHNLHQRNGGQEISGRRQKLPVLSRRREPLILSRGPNRKEALHHRPRLSRSPRAHRIKRTLGPRNPIPPRRTFNIRTSEVQVGSFRESCPHLFLQGCMFHGPSGGVHAFLPSSAWSFLTTSNS